MIKFMFAVLAVFVTMALLQPTPSEGAHSNALYYLTVLDVNDDGELSTVPAIQGSYFSLPPCIVEGKILAEYLETTSMRGIVVCIQAVDDADFVKAVKRIIEMMGDAFIRGRLPA